MRAFIAIRLPGEIHDALAREQARFRSVCTDARWIRPEGIHLTLKFLGQVSDAQVKAIVEALGTLDGIHTFPVEVRGFGFFPDARRPRVFWAGLSAPPALPKLAEKVEGAMVALGFPREQRAFSPHLTLARFKTPAPHPELQAALATRAGTSLGSFEVSEFFLWESKLSPQGAEYTRVARFPAF